MPFGNQDVTFVALSNSGERGRLGTYAQAETPTVAPGCRHRPLSVSEKVEYGLEVSTAVWKTTIPVGEYGSVLRATVLAAAPDDLIRVGGETFHIIVGPQHHVDMDGGPFKVTLLSKKQES